jgi:hypothetical protein
MAQYPVLRRLLVDGKTHEPGEFVELSDDIIDDLPDGVIGEAIPEAIPEDPKAPKPKDPSKT